MAQQIFVNLPVKDLKRSVEFFGKLGFAFNPKFTDENATCMIVAENIFVMLLAEKFFKTFTQKEISNAHQSTEVLLALSRDSRQQVDELADLALRSGGTSYGKPMDHGWMYQRAFADLDGHQWEIFRMDENAMPQDTK